METRSQKYYSRPQVAKEYDDERFTSLAGKMFGAFEEWAVTSNLPKKADNIKVLDAGTGTGRFAIAMAERGFNVVACDYSEAMLEKARSKVEQLGLRDRIKLTRQDVSNLTFPDNTFHFVCCIRVLINLDTSECVTNALKELARVCKPGGTIVFEIVNPKSLAFFTTKKESLITLRKTKELISSIPSVDINKYFGKRIVSPVFEKAPDFLLGLIDNLDSFLSRCFPSFCIRIYFVLIKK